MGPTVVVVPNFSEGRRDDVIEAVCRALQAPGVRLVYKQADPDHHRLDTTIVGAPEAVRRALLAAARVAVGLIDMDVHRGGHPRMGAVDVVPFVPLGGVSMADVVDQARAFGRELASTLDLPVYLYGEAALSGNRVSLADVRRGEYEGLREAVERGERLPDFGPHVIGKAGATAVGARKPLIAFNVYLSGGSGEAAREVARRVRESGGGLSALRAIGFEAGGRGLATVSMNLVDHEVTGLRAAFDAVVAEAGAAGMSVVDSEIVGLVPETALGRGDAEHIRLVGFDPGTQILERLIGGDSDG